MAREMGLVSSPHTCRCHLLHPLWRSDEQKHDPELNSGWSAYLCRVEQDPVIQDILEGQLIAFRDPLSQQFGSAWASIQDARLKLVTWWEKYRNSAPQLQRITLRLLS
eukprot:c25008_g2_i4 orf=377-700(-)